MRLIIHHAKCAGFPMPRAHSLRHDFEGLHAYGQITLMTEADHTTGMSKLLNLTASHVTEKHSHKRHPNSPTSTHAPVLDGSTSAASRP